MSGEGKRKCCPCPATCDSCPSCPGTLLIEITTLRVAAGFNSCSFGFSGEPPFTAVLTKHPTLCQWSGVPIPCEQGSAGCIAGGFMLVSIECNVGVDAVSRLRLRFETLGGTCGTFPVFFNLVDLPACPQDGSPYINLPCTASGLCMLGTLTIT